MFDEKGEGSGVEGETKAGGEEEEEEDEESESDEDDVQIHIGPIETQTPPFYQGRLPSTSSECATYTCRWCVCMCVYVCVCARHAARSTYIHVYILMWL